MKIFSAIGIVAGAILVANFHVSLASAQGVSRGHLDVEVGNPHFRHYSHYGHRAHDGSGYGYGYGYGYGGDGGGHRSYYGNGHVVRHRWHDTSHYDYHPGGYVRHYDHYDYVPGHYDFHPEGHWDRH